MRLRVYVQTGLPTYYVELTVLYHHDELSCMLGHGYNTIFAIIPHALITGIFEMFVLTSLLPYTSVAWLYISAFLDRNMYSDRGSAIQEKAIHLLYNNCRCHAF